MSIFNQITFFVLISEIAIFLLSLVPLTFIPVRTRKAFWIARIILLLVGGVFVDTVIRLQKLDSALHDRHDHGHTNIESTIEDLQYKTKLFYSQRNMYLSLTSFSWLCRMIHITSNINSYHSVIYRRMKDIYVILQLQEEADSRNVTLKALKAQVETMVLGSSKETGTTEIKSSATVLKEEATADVPKASDASEKAGLRKRNESKKIHVRFRIGISIALLLLVFPITIFGFLGLRSLLLIPALTKLV
ncbi:hypothetical protein BC829DRAFT_71104 [Chytridium lagenaria]|nr:hypothetical protein BC829DRAFT_71104 [Chytridium lagenaria]